MGISDKFFDLWEETDSLSSKAVKGGAILFFQNLIIKGLQFIRTVVVARLLFPDDVGLFALASLSLAIADTFIKTGLNSAVIQEKEDVKKYLDSVWTTNVLRGAVLALILFFGAPLFGNFFNNDPAIPLIRALALMALFEGFENIGMVLLQKELAFNRMFFYYLFGNLAQVGVIIWSAFFIFKNAWALVAGAIAGRLTFTIVSYFYHSYRPRFNFEFRELGHLFQFSKWIVLAGVISFFTTRGDSLTVGKLLSPDQLAFYQMAFALGTLVAVEGVKTLGSILFPLYSKIQEEKERMIRAFIRILRLVFLFLVPASIGIFALAPEIVTFVYGSKWLPLVSILYVAVLFGFLKSFEFLFSPLFMGIGKPHISTVAMIFQSLLMFGLIFPFVRAFGAVGAAWAALSGLALAIIIYGVSIQRHLRFNFVSIFKEMILPLLGSLVMWGVIVFLKDIFRIGNFLILLAYILVGAAVYFASILLFDRIFGRKIRDSYLWIKENI